MIRVEQSRAEDPSTIKRNNSFRLLFYPYFPIYAEGEGIRTPGRWEYVNGRTGLWGLGQRMQSWTLKKHNFFRRSRSHSHSLKRGKWCHNIFIYTQEIKHNSLFQRHRQLILSSELHQQFLCKGKRFIHISRWNRFSRVFAFRVCRRQRRALYLCFSII